MSFAIYLFKVAASTKGVIMYASYATWDSNSCEPFSAIKCRFANHLRTIFDYYACVVGHFSLVFIEELPNIDYAIGLILEPRYFIKCTDTYIFNVFENFISVRFVQFKKADLWIV